MCAGPQEFVSMISILTGSKPICLSLAKTVKYSASIRCSSHVQQASAPPRSTSDLSSSQSPRHEPRYNPLGIEMLPGRLYKQVFGIEQGFEHVESDCDILRDTLPSRYNLQRCIQHLRRHDLLPKQLSEIDTIYEYHKHLSTGPDHDNSNSTSSAKDIVMDIPELEGRNIDQHFRKLGTNYSLTYSTMAQSLIEDGHTVVDCMPKEWSYEPGWTRYEPRQGGYFITEQVSFPREDALVFDVETCLNDPVEHAPTLAVAVSSKAWYSWTSLRLVSGANQSRRLSLNDLIPFDPSTGIDKLIIGHNVGFDRSFMREQYSLEASRTKFLDTLSLHMCICGLTGLQRAVKVAHKRKLKDDENVDDLKSSAWIEKSSLNNLADVYEFHCGSRISKDERDIFIKGTMDDVRDNFQSLMSYCASDVKATFEVFRKLFPTFSDRFPHPVTLAGMLEMSTMYLPVDLNNWSKYIDKSQRAYDEYERRMSEALQELANDACGLQESEHSKDVWLWDIDWSRQSIKPNKTKLISWQRHKSKNLTHDRSVHDQVQDIYDTKNFMRQIVPFLPGFPRWYRDLCLPFNKASTLGDRGWQPGPCLITTQMRITPKLMRITWDGYPLHYNQKHGWGYLVPNGDPVASYIELPEDHPYAKFPIEELLNLCKDLPRSHILIEDPKETADETEDDLVQAKIEQLRDNTQLGTLNLIKLLRKLSKKKKVAPRYKNDFCEDVDIPGAYFIKLPHKNGPNFNVGNPLSKDFVSKMEDGTLSSLDNDLAKMLLKHSSSLSYWKNNHKRIKSQMVVGIKSNLYQDQAPLGAILPRVIVAGTVTRRAVEPTWLTASNQDTSRIGSELKAMIQAPTGYCFVGADVDSQELWIASLMGDSYSYKIHGGTGLSYMTLRGSKSDKTDMHSKTASLIGISRSEAKVLNYARIYGAGQKFIERFLINTNHHLKPEEAKLKAKTIFKETKGVRKFHYLKSSMNALANRSHSDNKDKPISIPIDVGNEAHCSEGMPSTNYDYESESHAKSTKDLRVFWDGGTESATFNKLEEIASSDRPRTPVLNCQISQALEPSQDQAKDFVTSRVNWVVQSSAVDFLHLVLVNMKWLFERLNINGRFSISIHDEVRYLVKEEDRYKAAFALQVSNLLVRAYFAYKLNMRDLPISVAFFSSVDIDKCLRKEVDMDCKSPSNPYGLEKTYNLPRGESLDVKQILERYTYSAKHGTQ